MVCEQGHCSGLRGRKIGSRYKSDTKQRRIVGIWAMRELHSFSLLFVCVVVCVVDGGEDLQSGTGHLSTLAKYRSYSLCLLLM